MTDKNEENNIIFNDDKPKTSIYGNNNYKIKDKSYINFIRISALYMHCAKQFLFNNIIHKYICKDYQSKS